MQYLSPIYAMLYSLAQKSLIQLKAFICYKNIPRNNVFYQRRNFHTGPLFKVSKILKLSFLL